MSQADPPVVETRTGNPITESGPPICQISLTKVISKIPQHLFFFILLAASLWLGSRGVNYVSATTPSTDSGSFAAIAMHLLAGKIPYAEVWDHKPPMVHLLHVLALATGGGFTAVRLMEVLFGAAGAALVFLILWRVWGRLWCAALGTVLFVALLYNPLVFCGGDLTEEYGAIFLLAAAFFAVEEMRSKNVSFWRAGLAAFFSVLAVLCKEPFVLSVLPWLLVLIPVVVKWNTKRSVQRIVYMVMGGLVPLVLMVAWLWISGGLPAFFDVISFNLHYGSAMRDNQSFWFQVACNEEQVRKKIFANNLTLLFLCLVSGAALLDRTFRRQNTGFQLAALGCTVMSFLGTMVSGYGFGHYYMQMVPALVLFAGSGMAWLDGLVRRNSKAGLVLLGAFLLVFVGDDFQHNIAFAKRVAAPFRKYEPYDMATKFLRERLQPGDLIWVPPGEFSYLYLTTGHLSPTRYIYAFEHLMIDTRDSTAAQKKQGILDDLKAHPPRFIVMPLWQVSARMEANTTWMEANYRLEKVPDRDCVGGCWFFYQFDWGPLAEQRQEAQDILTSGLAPAEEKAAAHSDLAEAYEADGKITLAIREYRLASDGGNSNALAAIERLCAIEGGKYRGERGCPKPDAKEEYDLKMLEDFEGRKEPVFSQWGPNNAKHAALTHILENKTVYRGKQAEHLTVRYAGYKEGKTTECWMLNVNVPLTYATHISWVTHGTRGVGMAMVVKFAGEHYEMMRDSGSDLDRKYRLEEWCAGDLDWQVNVSEDMYAWAKKTAEKNKWSMKGARIVRVGLDAMSLNQNDVVIDNVQAWFKADLVARKKAAAEKVLLSGSTNADEKARARRDLDELGAAYEKEGQIERAIKEYRLAADRGVSGASAALEWLCSIEGGKYRGERGCPKPDASEAYDIKMLEGFEGRKEPVFSQWGPNNAKHTALTHAIEKENVYRGKQAEQLAVQYAGYEEGKTLEYWMLGVNVPLTRATHISWMTRGTCGVGMAMVVKFAGEHYEMMWDNGSDLDRKYQLEEWRAGDLDWQVYVSEDVYTWAKKTAEKNKWTA